MSDVVTILAEELTAGLSRAAFTYDEVGATADMAPPPGYGHLSRSRSLLGRTLAEAAEELMTWQVHERAGLRVAASSPRVAPGVVVLMRLGIGAAALRIPCRVVYEVNEASRIGFAYGTLPGHPEQGEELFLLEQDQQHVEFRISAFSNPATKLARAGAPVSRWVQARMAERYLAALDRS